jgi:hypothetical protein
MTATTGNGGWTPPAGGPLWPGPDLLVPMAMDAFLIGDGNLASTFAATAPNYSALEMYSEVATAPFSTASPSVGVHLHWTLPYGLRHGRQPPGGELTFPPAPNRWLLTRLFYPASATPGTPPQATSWIILSDQYGADVSDGTIAFPDPNNPGNIVYLGQKVPYAGWSETAAGTPQWLTANGPGNQTFAATFDASLNVFSVLDTPPEAVGSLTYLLSGWNANYPSDPMFGRTGTDPNGWSTDAQWASLMDDIGWEVADVQAAIADWTAWRQAHPKVLNAPGQNALNPEQLVRPAQIVVHSMLLGIAWRGTKNQNYPPSLPGMPNLAVGETGSEALAAWLAEQVSPNDPNNAATIEQLLLAIGNGVANQLASDPVKVEDTLHAARFGSASGGTLWVVQRPNTGADGPPDFGTQSVPLDPTQTQLLIDLNTAQAQMDELDSGIAADQWELYAAYWKQLHNFPPDPNFKKLIAAAITRLSAAIDTATAARATALATRDAKKTALLAALGADYALATATAAPFCTGNDPVLLVAGANRSTVHDAPLRTGENDKLPTRFTGQTVTGITVQYQSMQQAVVSAQDLVAALTPLSGGLLPNDVPDLLGEGLLLDTTAAALIATLYFARIGVTPTAAQLQELTAKVAAQQSAAWNGAVSAKLDPQVLGAAAGLIGTLPDKISVEGWSQPWDPIFMDWSVQWYPTSPDPAHALDGWALGDIDLEWDQNNAIGSSIGTFMGRTVITEQLAGSFAEQLRKFSDDKASMNELPIYQQQLLLDAIKQFPQSDIVSQSMAGLTTQLYMRNLDIVGPVGDATIAKLVGNSRSELPNYGSKQNVPPFLPVRSGHFQITDVWVVDAYGQILRGVPAGDSAALPIRAQSVITPGPNRDSYVQIAPRYGAPTRSDFTFVSAVDDSIITNSSDATNPLAGWVVVDHLDYALALFDGAGESRGSLIVLDGTSGAGARWDPSPGEQAPFGGPPTFPDSLHLQNFARGVLDVETQGTRALSSLISIIDATLWQIDPDSIRSIGNLALLVGTPLALVRATLSMEPRGGPVYNQSWASTNAQNTEGYDKLPFSLRIGDVAHSGNGVVGYFLDDDYTRFYPVHGYSMQTGTFMAALRMGAHNTGNALRALAAPKANGAGANPYVVPDALIPLAADGTVRRLTVLMDPRGTVPLISGYLPSKTLRLQPGPVDAALGAMAVNFRIGPLLTDPRQIRMPLPAEIRGTWTWVERDGLTLWNESTPGAASTAIATFSNTPPQLTQGWLRLSNAFGGKSR